MKRRLVKIVVFVVALLPAAWLLRGLLIGDLGVNPAETIQLQTGRWALKFLLITLAVTPVRRIFHWNVVIQYRRMLGLFAFFYATLHLLTWIVFVHYFDVSFMIEDVFKRPFITVGMTVFVILFALAVTSNRWSIRKLGRKWGTLHRLVYLAAIGGVIHFWWLVKADITLPRRWAAAFAVLLGMRAWWWYQKRVTTSARRPVAAASGR